MRVKEKQVNLTKLLCFSLFAFFKILFFLSSKSFFLSSKSFSFFHLYPFLSFTLSFFIFSISFPHSPNIKHNEFSDASKVAHTHFKHTAIALLIRDTSSSGVTIGRDGMVSKRSPHSLQMLTKALSVPFKCSVSTSANLDRNGSPYDAHRENK